MPSNVEMVCPECDGFVKEYATKFKCRNCMSEFPKAYPVAGSSDLSELYRPINKWGEPIYAGIVRNRSGQDAGNIDYGYRPHFVSLLSDPDKQDIVNTAWLLYEALCRETGKQSNIERS